MHVDVEKLARNGRKTATYIAASFFPHYGRVLFSHLCGGECEPTVKDKKSEQFR